MKVYILRADIMCSLRKIPLICLQELTWQVSWKIDGKEKQADVLTVYSGREIIF